MPASSFLGVFAKSPIKPVIEHINQIHDTAMALKPFFEAVYQEDWVAAEKAQKEISRLEKVADETKREIRLNLPSGLFLPVERADLLELVSQQDRIANKAKDIAGLMTGRQLPVPTALLEPFKNYLGRCLDSTTMARDTINEFDDLLETGFRGRERDLVVSMIGELDKIEEDTDELQVSLRRGLREIENEMNPLDVMFLYQILDWVGDLADLSERVGNRFELMLARV
ncbi:MAG: Pit transporter accessory protein [Idiomarinaceae bacterium HL-53]|nr:MAG: Pit transporter accessory protein [Idiomarinaceae bacterium HL-53]CUS48287.1 hypothetical protein Ga0003345_1232 [Idiomarinaceae bacterium HL-53]